MNKHISLFLFILLFIFGSAELTPAHANDSCDIFYHTTGGPSAPPPPPSKSGVKKAADKVVTYVRNLFGWNKSKKTTNQHVSKTLNTNGPIQTEPKPQLQKQTEPKKQQPQTPSKQEQREKTKDRLPEEETKEYKAHNKDISAQMKRADSSYLYGTTAPVPMGVVREAIFDVFDTKWTKSQSLRTTEIATSNSHSVKSHTLLVNQQEAKSLVLAVPYGSKPSAKTYKEFKVTQSASGEYKVESLSDNPLPEKIYVELEPNGKEQMSAQQKAQLTRKSKILQDQWPSHILEAIKQAQNKGDGDANKIATILSEWIKFDGPYKYFSDNGKAPAETILEMANMKEFNCDGGAQIGATLLRDFFGIPTRIADGRRTSGKKMIDHQNYNVVDYSMPRHAWVEVFIKDEWVPFDFTPTNANPELRENNKKEELEEENDPLKRRKLGEPKESDKQGEEEKESEEQGKAKDTKQHPTPKSPSEKKNDQTQPPQIIKDAKQKKGPSEPERGKPAEKKETPKPTFSKIPQNYKSPLALLARQALLQTLDAGLNKKKWSELELLLQGYLVESETLAPHNHRAKSDLKKLTSNMFGMKDGTLAEMLTEAKAQIHVDPTVSYNYLKSIRDYLAELGGLRELSPKEKALYDELNSIMHEFSKLNHPSAKEADFTKKIMDGLPGEIIKEILRDRFPGLDKVGSVGQKSFVQAVKSGQMNRILQASLIGKHFNFLLNAEREHKIRYAKSIIRSLQQKNRNDDIVLARPEDIAKFDRWILDIQYNPDPVMMLLDNLLKDQQYMMGYRQLYPTAGSQNAIERKHSNIFFDISGSMEGRPAEVQASAVAAIVDKALSEKDPFGNHIHKVILFPFGNTVKPGISVSSAAEAKRVVMEFLSKATDANEGTDIQACFDTHFQMIRESIAQSKSGATDFTQRLKLNRANMILLTDGGGYVNKEKTLQELAALPAYVRTMFNLVSIGGKNHTLEEIVQYTNTKNSKSMVTEITTQMMQEFATDADKFDIDPEAFVFDKTAGTMEHDLINRIGNLTMPEVVDTVAGVELPNLISMMQKKTESQNNSVLISQLLNIESILTHTPVGDDLKLRFVTELVKNYQQLGGNSLDSLSIIEYSLLMKIIKLVRP